MHTKQPTAESAHDKKISRNQKWCLKWQAIRLKRKANAQLTETTELKSDLTDTKPVHKTVGKSTAEVKVQKPTGRGRKRKEKNDDEKPPPPKKVKRQKSVEVKVQSIKGEGKKRKEKVDENPTGGGRKRKEKASIINDDKKPPLKKIKQQKSAVSSINGGRNKRRSKPEKEEVSLEAMVNKYRQKLDQSSLSKWVH